ncbi:hypothetical protein [[Clostridium] innocuum]|uniref:hypothetical protein n=1 Tax=Clostridium innocuum TaxID=1522 RepID=UPI000D6AE701|nr:hypothetical protein [[Clostridium] innocuum]MCR0199529.1 hypothetical protein [[Clostridium] innocuum]MCR0292216.1 hypothetical protein [[Clostridium] innocuum]MCR0461103.1 hypothetical protein [[Clostridium] innocuum]PWJ18863.1 hypothetical protein ATF84_102487 [[Clostridium] innocuum]SSA39636.1 hypothetical protein SAMN04487929_102487 [[Clostridium] innocuum]
MSENKERKITFSEEVDDKINGFGLAITFVIIGIGLSVSSNFFENELVSEIIRWIFIIVGSLGLMTEYSKRKKKSNIKGVDDFTLGIVCVVVSGVVLYIVKNIYGKVIFFVIILFGLYGCITGLLKIFYSIYISMKERQINNLKNKGMISDLIIFLTQLMGLILIILQLIQAIS